MAEQLKSGKWMGRRHNSAGLDIRIFNTRQEAADFEGDNPSEEWFDIPLEEITRTK